MVHVLWNSVFSWLGKKVSSNPSNDFKKWMESLEQIISNIIATVIGIDFIFMSFLQYVCNRSQTLFPEKAPETVSE